MLRKKEVHMGIAEHSDLLVQRRGPFGGMVRSRQDAWDGIGRTLLHHQKDPVGFRSRMYAFLGEHSNVWSHGELQRNGHIQ